MTEELRKNYAGPLAELLQLGFVEVPPTSEKAIKFSRGREKICLIERDGLVMWYCMINDDFHHTGWKDYNSMLEHLRAPARKYLDDLSEQKARIAELEATVAEMRLRPYPGEDYSEQ